EAPSVGPGWSWDELDLVDEKVGGAPREQRDALKMLAVFLQHTDNKPEQQRLLCLDTKSHGVECETPFMMVHDIGQTFCGANLLNRSAIGSVNIDQWRQAPVWRDANSCIGNLPQSQTGTLSDPHISKVGVAFLAKLLEQLS